MAADPYTPATVLVPTQRLHRPSLYGDDRRACRAHEIMSQVATAEAICAAAAKVIIIAVWIVLGNGWKYL